jgi:hypothetical protein
MDRPTAFFSPCSPRYIYQPTNDNMGTGISWVSWFASVEDYDRKERKMPVW